MMVGCAARVVVVSVSVKCEVSGREVVVRASRSERVILI
jgi:hypothetical protein